MKIRGDFALAPLRPPALQPFEPRPEPWRHLPLVVVGRGEETVDALLPLEDRTQPPLDQADDHLARVRDERADDGLPASRVVLDLFVERLRERRERVL